MFPFIKIISSRNLIGLSEHEMVSYIKGMFMEAYISEEAILILDDIEGLIFLFNVGPMYSNVILQALKVLIKEVNKKKIFVF